MAFNVDTFRSHFAKHDDFAKTSKFDVRIIAPPGLEINASDLRFQCEATELPGYTVNTVDGRYYGVANPVATFPTFADLTLTFVCTGDFWEKKLFDRWMNLVIPINNYNPNYKDSYTSPKIEINQFSEVSTENAGLGIARDSKTAAPGSLGIARDTSAANFGSLGIDEKAARARAAVPIYEPTSVIYKVSFFGAFPTAIAPMNMNWADDSIHRLAVTFRYEYWITGELEQSSRPRLESPMPAPRPQQNRTPTASGSTPPVIDQRPASLPQTTPPPFRGGGGGRFAGGGASGGW